MKNLAKRSTNRRYRLCGQQLHQMLAMICNHRGKRSVEETPAATGIYCLHKMQGHTEKIF